MHRGKLIVVLALTLLIGKVQCLAACTIQSCGMVKVADTSKLPPCHRHKQETEKPAPCSHHVLVASSEAAPVTIAHCVAVATISTAVEPVEFRAVLRVSAPAAQASSPPGPAPRILRI
jgi:hypothetical protein